MLWRRLLIGLLLSINVFFLYQFVWSDQGLFSYLTLKERHHDLKALIRESEEKSLKLSQEIRWLENDREYQEKVIRSQMNFLRPNEVLYIFPHEGSANGTGDGEESAQ